MTDQAPGAEFLGHRFRDQRLLQAALTHSSLAAGSRRGGFAFDRLEFLGDRVLGLVVARLLLAAF
ncbi:MAG: ribonuclease III, partial [Alphaproteobacteria bacterium]|nr:ribonuclease III [Alphaproteobacteria bacterium]